MKILFFLGLTPLFFLALLSCHVDQSEAALKPSVIQDLMEGNNRYQQSHPLHPSQSKFRRLSLVDHQNPKVIVISCSDSRVPPEIIFDQGLGDLFVIRTAGNVIGDIELASIEYAVIKLNCNSIIVLGHEGCGAIQSFLEHPTDTLPGHLNSLVNFIRSQPVQQRILEHPGDKTYEAVINNIVHFVRLLKAESKIIQETFDVQGLTIYGAVYHMENGKVNIIEEDVKK